MPFSNTIALASKYIPILDEVYKLASLTSPLDGPAELAREGANANELVIPMLDMQGAANYSRSSGYVDGNVTLTNQTVICDYDRGRMFQVDNLDNAESAGIAFGRLAGEFIRTKIVPELDAYRIAKYASTVGISKATAALTTGAAVIAALRVAADAMNEDEVGADERYLFITPTLLGLVEDLDTTKSKYVLANFSNIITVPQSRMISKINLIANGAGGFAKTAAAYALTEDVALVSGKTYYTKSGDVYTAVASPSLANIATYYERTVEPGYDLNFLVVHKPAAIQFQKHVMPKIITPEMNQTADAWKFGYRNVGIAKAYENKLSGIYAHFSTT